MMDRFDPRQWMTCLLLGCTGCRESDHTRNRRNHCFEPRYAACLSVKAHWTDVGTLEGGRQVDGAIGSLDALGMIMRSHKVRAAQQAGKLTVLFDSGIRTGSDIIKALAMGAQGVLSQSTMSFL